ncbi:hypothetical protein ACLOJK_000126 [Asimina triloba]
MGLPRVIFHLQKPAGPDDGGDGTQLFTVNSDKSNQRCLYPLAYVDCGVLEKLRGTCTAAFGLGEREKSHSSLADVPGKRGF